MVGGGCRWSRPADGGCGRLVRSSVAVITLQSELSTLQAHVASQPPPQPQPPSSLSMSDFPFAGAATYDMSRLLIIRIHGQPISSSSMIRTLSPGGGEEFAGELLMRNQRGRKSSAPKHATYTN
ncbi:LOB domain-containing protein 30-like [Impatiens glandulifera]|uniref:LOB domain-containing protein 30-like n=1 Tax=Impatiens glandulifera TaxID=253017 RepID=UPI001FB13FFE|nr:LOB domain-containing protein 30-like [Impatiens glandulifera]